MSIKIRPEYHVILSHIQVWYTGEIKSKKFKMKVCSLEELLDLTNAF